MRPEQIESRLAAFRAMAAANPARYRAQATAFVLLGYTLYVSVLLLIASSIVTIAAVAISEPTWWSVYIFVALAVFLGAMLKAVWFTCPSPEGLPLTPKHAPRLYAELRELSSRLRAPEIHRILLNDGFGVEVIQEPRLGIFGCHRNWLVVGFPLLAALPPELFRAELARELGRLAGYQNPLAARLYRVRRSWQSALQAIEAQVREPGVTRAVMRVSARFWLLLFRWFIPRIEIHTQVLALEHRFAGDRAAADVVGAELAARSLAECHIRKALLQELWPTAFRPRTSAIPTGAHANLAQALGREIHRSNAIAEMWHALSDAPADPSQPSFVERLVALNIVNISAGMLVERLELGHAVQYSAAQHHLGGSLNALAAQLDTSSEPKTGRDEIAVAAAAHMRSD